MSERQVLCSNLQARLDSLGDGNRIKVIIGTHSFENLGEVERFLGLDGTSYEKNDPMLVAYAELTGKQIQRLSKESYVGFVEGEVSNGRAENED